MIFRACVLCLLSCACADEVTLRSSAGSEALLERLGFSDYVLKELVEQPEGVPEQGEPVTLKDVQFVSKISSTESLLVTAKNVTWKYDEEDNSLEKITYLGNKTFAADQSSGRDYAQSEGGAEYGFSSQLVRMFDNGEEGKLVINYDTNDDDTDSDGGDNEEEEEGGESREYYTLPIPRYDENSPPRILYLNADGEGRETASVFVAAELPDPGSPTGFVWAFLVNSPALECGGQRPSPIKVTSPMAREENLVVGFGSDKKSFWLLNPRSNSDDRFLLYVWKGCKLEEKKDRDGDVQTTPRHDFPPFTDEEKRSPRLNITYQGKAVTSLPLGMWIDVSDVENPAVTGGIVAINKDGKLLSTAEPE